MSVKLKTMNTTVDGKKEKVYIHLETLHGNIVGKGKSKRKLWFIPKSKDKKNGG